MLQNSTQKGAFINLNKGEMEMALCENHCELIKTVTENTVSCKSAHHRIDEIKGQQDAIYKVAASVELIAGQVKDLVERVTKIERTPGQLALKYIGIFFGALIVGLAGYLLAKGGLK